MPKTYMALLRVAPQQEAALLCARCKSLVTHAARPGRQELQWPGHAPDMHAAVGLASRARQCRSPVGAIRPGSPGSQGTSGAAVLGMMDADADYEMTFCRAVQEMQEMQAMLSMHNKTCI